MNLSNRRQFQRGAACVLFAMCLSFLAVRPLFAANALWEGDTSQDWNELTNWDQSPTGNNAYLSIDGFGPYPILSANSVYTPVDVVIGTGAGFDGRFDHRAGTLNTGNGNWIYVGTWADTSGVYNLADTSTTGGTLTGFGTGTGSVNIGGTHTTSGKLNIGASNSVGTVNMNTTGTLQVEQDNIGIVLGDGGTSTGNFNLDAGTVQINSAANGIAMLIGTNGGDGNFKMSGGTINATGNIWVGDNNTGSQGLVEIGGGAFNAQDILVGRANGSGTVNLTAGTLTATRDMQLARSTAAGHVGVGKATVGAGATLNVGKYLEVGLGGNGANGAEGTLTVTGTVNVNTGNLGGDLTVGVFDSVKGTLTINGGAVVRVQNNAELAFGNAGGNTAIGVVNHDGGSVAFYSDSGTTLGGTGFLNMQQAGSGTYTYNLNGGTLTVPRIDSVANGGSRTFNFNGGTLKPTGDSAAFMQFNTNGGAGTNRTNIRNGGAVIDTAGFNVTIGRALEHSNIGGDNAIDGGLTKNGAGTLTLSAVNSYTGATAVNAGTLKVDGSIASEVTVNGGWLKGTGATGGVTIAASGSISAGSSPGSLDVAGDYSQSGTMLVEIAGNSQGSTYDLIAATGNATLTSGSTVSVELQSYAPGAGSFFDVLTALDINGGGNSLAGITFIYTNAALGPGLSWLESIVSLGGGEALRLSVVPEPGAAALLLVGLGILPVIRRRRRSAN